MSIRRPAHVRQPALVTTVARTLRDRRLCEPGQSLLVAVSGGPDSVALLRALAALAPSWRLSLAAVHCNYGLRGRESQRDEAFVRRLCARLRIPCHVHRVSDAVRKGRPTGSLQPWARELRYRLFSEVADREGLDRIAVGHTADDQAETVLLWMLRGAGTTGLSGMPAMREGRIIRPLLESTREEVLRYLEFEAQPFRTDSSNRHGLYRRNRVRREVLPVLASLNPAIVRTLAKQADLLAEDDVYLHARTVEALCQVGTRLVSGAHELNRSRLAVLPVALQRRVVREVLREVSGLGTTPTWASVSMVLTRLVHGSSRGAVTVCGAVVRREYDRLVVSARHAVSPQPTPSRSVGVSVVRLGRQAGATLRWAPTGQTIRLRMVGRSERGRAWPTESRACAVLDADRVTPQFRLRSWEPGDWFCPAGMGGHRKKLQDFWTDAKIPRAARAMAPVMVAPEGIVWVVGHRVDQRFVPGPTTRRVVIAESTPMDAGAIAKERGCREFSGGQS